MEPPDLAARVGQLRLRNGYFFVEPPPPLKSQAKQPPKGNPPLPLDPAALLDRKLENPALPLNSEQSIALLSHCIQLGVKEAKKAKGADLTVCIGNTGSGKSTLVNYLLGCTMQKMLPSKLGLPDGLGKVVTVKPVRQGGQLDEVVRIGHSSRSTTVMPHITDIGKNSDITLCDCPGFLDNRGPEIDIANAVNIHKALINASSIRIIILLNYHTLQADRARGLNEMVDICCKLFGSKESLLSCQESILLGMTNIPLREAVDEEEEEEGDNQFPLSQLKKEILAAQLTDPFTKKVVSVLVDKLFIYDPIDSTQLKFKGALKRKELLGKISALPSVENPADIFKTVLTSPNQQGLHSIADSMNFRIQQLLKEGQNFQEVAKLLKDLQRLEIIENAYVTKLIATTRNLIVDHFEGLIRQFDLYIQDDQVEEARKIVKTIKKGLEPFEDEIELSKSLEEMKEECEGGAQKEKARQEVDELAELERKIRKKCGEKNFHKAQEHLKTLEEQLQNFAENYGETGVEHNVELDELQELYEKTKAKYDKQTEIEERNRRREENLRRQAEEAEAERKREQRARKAEKDAAEARAQKQREREAAAARERANNVLLPNRVAEPRVRNVELDPVTLRNTILGGPWPAVPFSSNGGFSWQLQTQTGLVFPIVGWNGFNPVLSNQIVIEVLIGPFKGKYLLQNGCAFKQN